MKTLFRFIISGLYIISIPISLSSQAYRKSVNPDNYGTNFIELSNHIDMFYDTAVGSNRSGYKQWKRWEWFAMHHLDENGQLGNYGIENIKALEDMERMPDQNQRSAANGDWYNLGHSSVSGGEAKQGRINSIAFDPVNGSIVYVASAAGGIWKSTNNGISWTNLTIDLPILCFSDIIVAPAPNNNILYALSGDIAGSANVYRHSSIGVIKSYDSGATWTRTALTIPLLNQFSGFKLLMHPSNPSIILAAMADGIHRTMDGGNTWANIMGLGTVNDMEFDLNNLDTVYFTLLNTNFFYRLSLTTLTTASTFIIPSVDRMEIAVTPDNPKAVYVLAGPGFVSNGMNLFNGLFYSGNSGSSFSLRSQSCSGNGDLFNSASSIAWYAITIVVDANEENNIIVGGLNLFRSTNGGVTLTQVTSNSIHSDQHNLKRNPLNGDLWLGNDGGLYRSTDNGITWNNKSNGLTINEYYRISGTNNSNDLMLGGTQDCGQFLMDAGGNFQSVLGGDGMDNYFNSYDNTVAYACSQNGGLKRSINYGQAFYTTNLPNGGNGAFYPWITPIVQHPPYYDPPFWHNTDVIYVYSLNGIMRSTDGTTWTNIGPSNIGQVTNSKCPSMVTCSDAQGITNLYISNGNKFWACFNPLDDVPSWSLFALPINNTTYISALAVNPAVRTEVWATISGYVGGTKVFRSQNGGLTWVNLSLSLPNTPIYSIVFANNSNNPSGAVYVGTEIGVFYTDDNLPDWVPFSNRLPHAPVTDLSMNYFTGELKAATYGRGVWETELYQTCPSLVLVDFDINQGQFSFESSNLIQADHFIQGGIGANVTMKAANQIKLKPGFKIFSGSYAHMKIGNCGEGVLTFTNENTPTNAKEENNPSTEEEEKD